MYDIRHLRSSSLMYAKTTRLLDIIQDAICNPAVKPKPEK